MWLVEAAPFILRPYFIHCLQVDAALAREPGLNSHYSGSTAVVCLLQGRRLTTAWVGDSKAVLARQVRRAPQQGRVYCCRLGRPCRHLPRPIPNPPPMPPCTATHTHQDPRGLRAICLTKDHKPNHPDERARILASSGRVERWVVGRGYSGGGQALLRTHSVAAALLCTRRPALLWPAQARAWPLHPAGWWTTAGTRWGPTACGSATAGCQAWP